MAWFIGLDAERGRPGTCGEASKASHAHVYVLCLVGGQGKIVEQELGRG